ncbi:tetratricopeptide repeat protein [Bacteroidota bacterium]
MKKVIISISFLIMASGLLAQKNEVQNAINYIGSARFDLAKAKESIDKATDHPSTSNYYKTWYYRGKVYLTIFESRKEEEKKLDENALEKSHEAYLKYLQIDTKKRKIDDTIKELWRVANHYFNRGSDEFNAGVEAAKNNNEAEVIANYAKAVTSFENSTAIYQLPQYELLDTLLVYRTGLAALRGKQYDKAMKYFNQCIDFNYGGEDVFLGISDIYMAKGDTIKAIETLERGIKVYPDNNLGILANLIDFYVQSGKSVEALNYINLAIEKNPNHNVLFHIKGKLFDDLGEFDKAVEAYSKAIEIKPDYSDSNYNLAIMYFNKGADIFNESNSVTDNDKYNEMQDLGKEYYTKSLPYFETCHKIEPTDAAILDLLKRITYRLGLTDRNREINELIKNLR